MNPTGLLSALRKYRVRDNSDPIENFVTEAFAWLLKTDSNFSTYFLMTLHEKHSEDETDFQDAHWDTQCNWDKKFPDMVCTIGEAEAAFVYVFEHKVWSHLHQNQLANYRAYAEERYKGCYKLILLTAHRGQHDQNPDEAICWSDVYTRIEGYLRKMGDTATRTDTPSIAFIFSDFLNLLEELGLAPLGAFKHGEIACYSSNFRDRMNSFWEVVSAELNKSLFSGLDPESRAQILQCQDFHIEKQPDKWGRIGITLFRENRPSIFVGVILDVADHFIQYSTGKGPDCSIMLCFDEAFHSYRNSSDYQNLTNQLSETFDGSDAAEGWLAYDHLCDQNATRKNYNHPFYIRKPLVDVIPCGRFPNDSFESQAADMAERLKVPLWKTLGVEIWPKEKSVLTLAHYRNTPSARSSVNLTNNLFLGRVQSYFHGEFSINQNIWWDKGSQDWALCLKFIRQHVRPEVHIGINLYKIASGYDAWFFFNPAQQKSNVSELLKYNDFIYLDKINDSDEHQLKAHRTFDETADDNATVEAAADFARECLRGLGWSEKPEA